MPHIFYFSALSYGLEPCFIFIYFIVSDTRITVKVQIFKMCTPKQCSYYMVQTFSQGREMEIPEGDLYFCIILTLGRTWGLSRKGLTDTDQTSGIRPASCRRSRGSGLLWVPGRSRLVRGFWVCSAEEARCAKHFQLHFALSILPVCPAVRDAAPAPVQPMPHQQSKENPPGPGL